MKLSRAFRVAGFGLVSAFAALFCAACEGEYVIPITAAPTHKVDQRLIGNWVEKGGTDRIRVRSYDEMNYIVSYNDDLYRAYHSDLGKMPLVTLQDVDSPSRIYAFVVYKLSDDGKTLSLRAVEAKVIPKQLKIMEDLQKLLKKEADNPALFGDEGQFERKE